MSRLHRLQDQLQAHILRGDDAVRDAIVGTARVGADVRLGIYASAYRLRLVEALDTDYPGLHALAGDQSFDQMCRAYIDAHPSAFRSLRWFGHRFAEFLRATEPFSRQPAFAEMAAFEWAMSDVFDAADVELATVADMAAVPADGWPALRFGLQGSVRRLDLRWNVATIWKSIDAGIEPPPLVEQSHPVGWLVWRQELRTQFRSLEVDEAWALDALRRGATFAELCEGLTEWIDAAQVAVHAAGRLKRWLEDGLIRRLEI
jgi:hypothetical protein